MSDLIKEANKWLNDESPDSNPVELVSELLIKLEQKDQEIAQWRESNKTYDERNRGLKAQLKQKLKRLSDD